MNFCSRNDSNATSGPYGPEKMHGNGIFKKYTTLVTVILCTTV
jgi:hypothetical protein